ncbi:MAG TPA: F0F1 ATP synthase subunit gamma [Gammaproteobacteria bacterium]|nr:F0F1 ATP synthase subunit gamma [Gammaproteobacteria bacterium]
MTRRRDLEHHQQSLGEIRNIMNSMKTLAFMETRKLTRYLQAQQTVVGSIEAVAADFLDFHADTLPETVDSTPVILAIGTERGFCGNFNQSVVDHLESAFDGQKSGEPFVIAVGAKLHSLLDREKLSAAFIDGAGVVEEIPSVLQAMVQELSAPQRHHGMLTVYALYHSGDGIAMQKLLPPFQHLLSQGTGFAHPPVLQLSPPQFMLELTEHYLFAVLHAILYSSLMAENLNRMTHLESAVSHLDDRSQELARRCRAMRQEEIIEEIEVILLSSSGLDEPGFPGRPSGTGKPSTAGAGRIDIPARGDVS